MECCKKINSGFCECKYSLETVYHFLLQCYIYHTLRQSLQEQIMYIFNYYNLDFNVKNLLFLPLHLKIQHRKHVLSNVAKFVYHTKRLLLNKSFT